MTFSTLDSEQKGVS